MGDERVVDDVGAHGGNPSGDRQAKGLARWAPSATLGDDVRDLSTADPDGGRDMADQIDGIDFALAAYREEGVWTVQELAHDVLEDVETLSHALRRFPGDGGAVGMVAIDEDFFLIVRVAGPTHAGAALRHHRRRRVGARQLGRGVPRPADARGRGRPGPGRRPRPARRPRHARHGHGRPARRLRPLPRRDALRHRPPGRLRRGSSTTRSASRRRDHRTLDGPHAGGPRRGARRAGHRRRPDRRGGARPGR